MTGQSKIGKWLEYVHKRVREAGNAALCDQLQHTLDQSVNLHAQLEGGYHRHHTLESDTHGWAVAEGQTIVGSGASHLTMPNEYGSAEESARREAVNGNPGQKGVFAAIMVYPFEGKSERPDDGDLPPTNEAPHDSVRFEEKIQDILKESAVQGVPEFLRKNKPSAKK